MLGNRKSDSRQKAKMRKTKKMDSRSLAALLSPLISQLLLLFLLLFPSSNPISIADWGFDSGSHRNLLSLIAHFVATAEIAASFSLLPISRKRKRRRLAESDSTDEDDDDKPSQLVQGGSAVSRDPDSLKLLFRMSSSTFEWLAGLLEPLLECRDPADSPLNLSAETRLGVGLFRLSTGADYAEISRRFNVSEPVARFCVKQLCRVLCTNFRFWVGFPGPAELSPISAAFETLTGLPNCCGMISCTRFEIVRGNKHNLSSDEKSCRESIAAQIVVDSSSRILSIIAGFRGETGNSQILKASTMYKDIEGGNLLDSRPIYINGVSVPQYLVGEGDYPLLPWLIVPFAKPEAGSDEEKFNAAHRLMRHPALRTIASLKKWGALSKPIEAEFKTAVAYVGACSILHNVLLMREEYSALAEDLDDCSLSDQSCDCHGETSLEESSRERKASAIRRALATRVNLGLSS